MFRSFVKWYRTWEGEQLQVLGRRCFANQPADLSPVERQQLNHFSSRFSGGRWLMTIAKQVLLYTVVGAALHLALPKYSWTLAIFMANLIGITIAWMATVAWFNYRWLVDGKRKMFVRFVLGVTIGLAIGSAGFGLIEGRSLVDILTKLPNPLFISAVVSGTLVVVPMTIIAILRNRHHQAVTAQLQHDAERERLARELSESQLRLLRAQIEPHFLFNTLGAVQQLAQQGAPGAAELTANLITFLRASLTDMRSEAVSLEREFALVEAYLRVMKARLGDRLHVTFDLPDALASLRVPSMIVLTLAENAIKHGIEPSLRGGTVAISAHRQGDAACLRVQDSGVGMGPGSDTGLGLDNARRRLKLTYGGAASLTLRDADPGTIAELIIPIEGAT